jgi:two-component system chemotaxis sensor kinase CheA
MLPKEITDVELHHVKKINKVALWVCVAHIPLFLVVAWACDTSMVQALAFGGFLIMGPLVASQTLSNPRTLSLVYGFTSMGLGALLVHLGQGPVQIEMHFHFFAALALLAVWGNPLIIWVATVTVAVHHGLFSVFLPASVFNYDAPYWVTAVHAAFVVAEAIAASYIARNFYDNVIGLEKIVQAKTVELKGKNNEMRLILDNTVQGFLAVNLNGDISGEVSSAFAKWFGEPKKGQKYWDLLAGQSMDFARLTKFGLEDMSECFFDLDYYLDSLPTVLNRVNDTETESFEFKYSPVFGKKNTYLVVVSDITERLKAEQEAVRQMEVINTFNMIAKDRDGFQEYLETSAAMVNTVVNDRNLSDAQIARLVHTLKGNSGVFQVSSIGDVCHKIEERREEFGKFSDEDREFLRRSWSLMEGQLNEVLSGREKGVEISDRELSEAIEMVDTNKPTARLKEVLRSWKNEPTRKRLERIANQAKSLANRLSKGEIEIEIKDNGLRLEREGFSGFWSVFGHVLRNSIDHGLETPDERKEKIKKGKLTIETRKVDQEVVISIADDGRGLDVEAIAGMAGLSPDKMDSERLLEIICRDGFTTRSEANEYSGRGVGMSAVRNYCDQNKIVISLETKSGRGTKFEFRRRTDAA